MLHGKPLSSRAAGSFSRAGPLSAGVLRVDPPGRTVGKAALELCKVLLGLLTW